MIYTRNRVSDFLDAPETAVEPTPSAPSPSTPTPVVSGRPRTAAQAEASRRNGAAGRGPATAEGRARSARNALKHGLFAKRVVPTRDDAGEQRDYEQHLRGLVDEFGPATRTEQNFVELLAGDYVKLARIRACTEAAMDPGPIRTSDPLADARAAEEGLEVARHLLDRFAAGQAFDLRRYWQDGGEVSMPSLLDDVRSAADACHKVWRRAARGDTAARAAVPSIKALSANGDERTADVLCDREPVPGGHGDRWRALLEELVALREHRLHVARGRAIGQEHVYREQQLLVLNRFDRVRTLGEYEFRVRRDIERTTALLLDLVGRRPAGPGSFLRIDPPADG